MFVALSKFTIANDMAEQVKEAFVNRPRLVEDAPGFLRLDVISPIDEPQEVWLLTYWENEQVSPPGTIAIYIATHTAAYPKA